MSYNICSRPILIYFSIYTNKQAPIYSTYISNGLEYNCKRTTIHFKLLYATYMDGSSLHSLFSKQTHMCNFRSSMKTVNCVAQPFLYLIFLYFFVSLSLDLPTEKCLVTTFSPARLFFVCKRIMLLSTFVE